jgi:phytoene dehydrogenase-like protein
MSGLAAGIRLAHFDKSVLVLDRHNVVGGLNSYYSFDARKFDVGLHAVTNYVAPGVKGTPLSKICRQLRITREELGLAPQTCGSRVVFPGVDLRFSNDFELLRAEVRDRFPDQVDGFDSLTTFVREFDPFADDLRIEDARPVLAGFITEPILLEMILCPLMYYGSARAGDMDLDQFVILFRSLYLEGFGRPIEGVRRILRLLQKKFRTLGGERKMKCGVSRIEVANGRAKSLTLDDGQAITADIVLSSIGAVETARLCGDQASNAAGEDIGRITYVETITVLDKQPAEFGWNDTIIFFSNRENFFYDCPEDLVDTAGGILCFPNNYDYADGQQLDEGFLRITALANYGGWTGMNEDKYLGQKAVWSERLTDGALKILPPINRIDLERSTLATDMFTPRTVKKYTGHLAGAIYGSHRKIRDGRTHLDNVFLCGTDQGFLGITGAMLSGISMANRYGLGS